jgi:hypothetical protein
MTRRDCVTLRILADEEPLTRQGAAGPRQRELERVMGVEPTLVAWDKRKQWPLPGSCRCVLEGPLLAADSTGRCNT